MTITTTPGTVDRLDDVGIFTPSIWTGKIVAENGSRFGSKTSWDEFTEWQCITDRPTQTAYPF